ncbi:MAG: DNA-methyltransferase [Aquificaceae bacterium]
MQAKPYAKLIIGDSRSMQEIGDGEIDLIVTSPPYWHIKDYGVKGQIGYGQGLHEYLKDLYMVWKECYRVLREGGRLCINVGDQFSRSVLYGRYKVVPIHAEVIVQCESLGFDYMGSIIWQKKTTMNTTGGANIMGSFPYPPNGIVEIDYEFILIFKKPGRNKKVEKHIKEASKLTKEEWKEYFSGHWRFAGAKKLNHEAMFPEELPKRLIKMFSFVGDTVLDPFLGSGTTMKVALQLGRNAIGYEINKNFLNLIISKVGQEKNVEIIERKNDLVNNQVIHDYVPKIMDARPLIEPSKFKVKKDDLYKVIKVLDEETLETNTGLRVKFLGIRVVDKERTMEYLKNHLMGKEVFLKSCRLIDMDTVKAYVYLKNKLFINAYLLKATLALPDLEENHAYREKFIRLWKEMDNGKGMDIKHSNE